jgi:hypothetical protein
MVHWKLACTPLLDEAIHHSGVKVGAGKLNCCLIQGFHKISLWVGREELSTQNLDVKTLPAFSSELLEML